MRGLSSHAIRNGLARGFQLRVNLGGVGLEVIERGDAGGHGERVAAERAGLVDGAERRQPIHDLALPPKTPTGKPPPTILPSVTRSGRCCRVGTAPPSARRKPVITSSSDEQSAVPAREFAQTVEVPRRGRDAARVADHGLKDDGGDFVGVCGERSLNCAEIVVRQARA